MHVHAIIKLNEADVSKDEHDFHDAGMTGEPVSLIAEAFKATVNGKLSWESAIRVARSSVLANAITTTHIDDFRHHLGEVIPIYADRTLLLGEMIRHTATVLVSFGRNAYARQLLEAVQHIYELYASPAVGGQFLFEYGRILSACEDNSDACACFDSARQLLHVFGTPREHSICYFEYANCLRSLNQIEESFEAFQAAIPLLAKHGLTAEYYQSLTNRACMLHDFGRLDEALAGYEEVIRHRDEVNPFFLGLCFAGRSEILQGAKQPEEALSGFAEALSLFESHATPDLIADYRLKRAAVLVEAARFVDAVADYDAALKIIESIDTPVRHATCLMDRADVLCRLNRFDSAAVDYTTAADLLRPDVNESGRYAHCLIKRAEIRGFLGRHSDAVADFREALPILRQSSSGQFSSYDWYKHTLVDALDMAGLPEESEAEFDFNLETEIRSDPWEQAETLTRRAVKLHNSGHFSAAVSRMNAAIAIWETNPEVPSRVKSRFFTTVQDPNEIAIGCRQVRANSLEKMGLLAEAVASYDEVVPYYKLAAEAIDTAEVEANGDHQGCQTLVNYGQVLVGRARSLHAQGKVIEAFIDCCEALPLLKLQYTLQSRLIDGYSDDERDFLRKNVSGQYASCLTQVAVVLCELQEFDASREALDEAMTIFRMKGDDCSYADCLVCRSTLLCYSGANKDSLADLLEAEPLVRRHGSPHQRAIWLMNRASITFRCGMLSESATYHDEALPVVKKHGTPIEYIKCLYNKALVLDQLNKTSESVVVFNEAREMLRHVRRMGRVDESSLEFTAVWEPLYRLSVAASLICDDLENAYAAVNDGKGALIYDLRLRVDQVGMLDSPAVSEARSELTQWMRTTGPSISRLVSPDEKTNEEYHVERNRRTLKYLSEWGRRFHGYQLERHDDPVEEPVNRAAIQACLPDDWAIIDYWRTEEDEFVAFVLFRDFAEYMRLPFSAEEMAPHWEELFNAVNDAALGRIGKLEGLSDLYQCFLGPIVPLLRERSIQGLYIVPHDFLHRLPLHVACDAKTGKYLCDEFAVAYLPSAAMLPQLPPPDPSGLAFVLSNPESGTEYTLPFAQWEGERLQIMLDLGPDQIFMGKCGTIAATERWSGAGLVHFSCHGMGDAAFGARSHLRLADDLLLAHDVVYRRPPLRKGALVVLNGCQTGVSDVRAVNESLGLMTAFLIRGASSVLSTQWCVEDLCAAEMSLKYVEAVRLKGASPANALKEAQRYVREMTAIQATRKADDAKQSLRSGSYELTKADCILARSNTQAGNGDVNLSPDVEAVQPNFVDIPPVSGGEYRGIGVQLARPRVFDDPSYWGAFRIIGRVT